MNLNNLRIALDLDDTVFGFYEAYNKKFPGQTTERAITKNVFKLRHNKEFWENLPLLERPNFEPHIYATKRVNSKTYTKNCLLKHGLPIKPIYQIYSQADNKGRIIKGRCDVLIDDSWFNVQQCLAVGVPALLITRPHNAHIDTPYRVNHLKYKEIGNALGLDAAITIYQMYKGQRALEGTQNGMEIR